MGKDLLKSLQGINNDINLKSNEALALFRLVEYYNTDFGYAYPKYDDLKVAIKTKRSDTVSTALKGLVTKGYITIEKTTGNKNKYFIHKHLHFIDSVVEEVVEPTPVITPVVEEEIKPVAPKEIVKPIVAKKPVDSNGNKPLDDQIHIDEVLNPVVIELSEHTGFNQDQVKELLTISDGDKAKVINAFEYMENQRKQRKINNPFEYTKWAINNHTKVLECTPSQTNKTKELKFNNFTAREYNYGDLETKLLGWDDEGALSDNLSDYVVEPSTFDFETALKSI